MTARRVLIGLAAALLLAGCGTTTEPEQPSTVTATITTSVPTTIGSRIPEAWDTTTLTVSPTTTITIEPPDTPTPPEDVDRPPSSVTPAVDATPVNAVVESVTDGDTIRVIIDGKSFPVRIIGINTPETVDPRKPVECGGPESSAALAQLLGASTVVLVADPSQGDTDRYGRLLRYVGTQRTGSDDILDIGLTLIQAGRATEYTFDTAYQRQAAYQQAEAEAKANKRGNWATC